MRRFLLKALACVALVVFLASTAYAIGYAILKVKENEFQTGTVDVAITTIEKNDKYYVNLFQTTPVYYEPGMTVRGDFVVHNRSNDPSGVWYRVYVDNVTGQLQDVLHARILDAGGRELFSGYMSQLNGKRLAMPKQLLANGKSVLLTMELHYDEAAGNETQEKTLDFDLCVVAVQRKNNPDGLLG